MSPVAVIDVYIDAVRHDLARATAVFPAAVETMRRAMFRMHLMANVTTASQLLGVIEEVDGVDFQEAALAIPPPLGWPGRPLRAGAHHLGSGSQRGFTFTFDQMLRRHRRAGRIVSASAVSDDMIAVRVVGDGLELTAIDGGLRIETSRGLARIVVDGELPSVISVACKGRPIDALVSHRWLDGRGWPILAFDDLPERRTAILIGTGRDDWRLPFEATLPLAATWGSAS